MIGEFEYGGLFLRMPWTRGIEGSAVNAARQRNRAAEGQRAMWLDVGMQVEGRDDMARVAMFDHPDNEGFPHPWRAGRAAGRRPGALPPRGLDDFGRRNRSYTTPAPVLYGPNERH